jgi:hypothetical protein
MTFAQEFSKNSFNFLYLSSFLTSFLGVKTKICPAIFEIKGQNIG